MRAIACSGSMAAISSVELRISANSTVRRFRSPPLALNELSNWLDSCERGAAELMALPQFTQKRLSILFA